MLTDLDRSVFFFSGVLWALCTQAKRSVVIRDESGHDREPSLNISAYKSEEKF